MKEKIVVLKENKIALILLILILFMVCIGISYSLWKVNLFQTTANTLATDCFNITFTEANNIELLNTYPMYDEDGSKLTPYTFTIKNNCASYATYQVQLEILNTSTLSDQYLKVMLDTKTPDLLTNYREGEITLENAKSSYILDNNALDKNEEKTYNLRVWLDENVTLETEGVQNSTWSAKVTITAKYSDHLPTDYELCVAKYGEDSINCSIIAQLDSTGKCPTVNEDGTVKFSSSESTNGYLCSAPDDYGTSYYYRGNVENNWVKFAGYYWRILRINGDGSIRMIYAGDASVIDALDNKEEVLKNGYDDSTTKYTQIGESPYNEYWKKDNVQETVNSYVYHDNAGVGYMYGNRDGIVEGSTEYSTNSHAATTTIYYAKEYTYDAEKDRFTLKDPIGLLGTEITEDYIGWYTINSAISSGSMDYLFKVTSVEPSDGSSDAKVGYSYVRYGTTSKEKAQTNTNDSTIKEAVDSWYESHIKDTEYEQYIADTLFCNDRSLASNADSSYSQLGYGIEKTKYRGYSSVMITLNCVQQNDRFTVDDEIMGNGDLIYPIGLFTNDEVRLAGGFSDNYNFYLYTGNNYWIMSSIEFNGSVMYGRFLNTRGSTSLGFLNSLYGVRPVINLKPNSLNTGDGTASNPYRIE